MEENIVTRLKLFIDTNGLTSSQFADMCGIARPTVSQILSGRNQKISDKLITQIHQAFPDLSIVWLMFGEGPVKNSGSDVRLGQITYAIDPGQSADDIVQVDTPEIKSENSVYADNSTTRLPDSTLRGLNIAENNPKPTKNQLFESDMRILDLQRQIDQMKQNPRKVIQITIYYDDSTFETFVPK